jgi:hypothetical protein
MTTGWGIDSGHEEGATLMARPRIRRSGSRRIPIRVALSVGIVVVVLAFSAGATLLASGALTSRHTISGDYILVDSRQSPPLIEAAGSGCRGTGGYSDIAPGTPVTLLDAGGKLLGATTLEGGSRSATECDFTFSIPDVPEVGSYTVEVSHRGEVTNTLDEMKAHGWTFALSLGQ